MNSQNKFFGDGHPVFFIAEIGYNFNTLPEALESVDAAAECGADAIKFQTFRAETVTSRFTDFPAEAGATNQYDEFKQYELSKEWHATLFARAKKKGILAFSTPAYYDDVDLLENLKVPLYKIGSDDLTNLPFLDHVARKGKPMIISTGMANMAEVDDAVRTIESAGSPPLAILHCLSNYPIKDPRLVNLRAIQTLQQAFGHTIGFSDHTMGFVASLGAVALGARVIEKHFTLDRKLKAPDAFFSVEPRELKQMIQGIRELEQEFGDGRKVPAPTETHMRLETRKSTIAARNIRAGEIITKAAFIIKRPGTGVPPKQAELIVGRKAKEAIRKDETITWDKLA